MIPLNRIAVKFSIMVAFTLLLGCSNNSTEKTSEKKESNSSVKKYPELKLIEDFFDFGSIKEGEVISHTFHFKNIGDDKLIVKDLIPDCGCTLPKIDKKEFEPNEEGSVEVIFDSKGWQGSQYKSVTLRTNAPDREKSVTIKANVVPNGDL